MSIPPPLPAMDPDTQPFWDGAQRGELLIQRCTQCDRRQFYPRLRCVRCGGAVEWIRASGDARVYTYTVVHRAAHEAFASLVPYVVALVDLAEGPRMMTRLRVSPEDVRIGQDVRVAFERQSDDVALPVFEALPR
jgi:uncharacterized OB-fold protein